jgi:hypothetical protein
MNRSTLILACAALAGALSLAARGAADAAADVTETRTPAGFDRVQVNGAFDVDVTAGRPGTHVTISGPADAVRATEMHVDGRTLRIATKAGLNVFSRAPHIAIALPVLRGFANDGAASAHISGIAGDALELSDAGAAKIAASGRVRTLAIELNGAGTIDTTGLDARDVTVDNNGVGSVRVRASGRLTANVNGVGEIRYAGTPANVDSHVNGIGRISRL